MIFPQRTRLQKLYSALQTENSPHIDRLHRWPERPTLLALGDESRTKNATRKYLAAGGTITICPTRGKRR
jgi:hypothetical protein